MDLQWMAWTLETALFFGAIAALIAAYTVWGIMSPSVPRRGFLPMPTTRGDRLFLGLMGSAWINLAWLGLPESPRWIALVQSSLLLLVIRRTRRERLVLGLVGIVWVSLAWLERSEISQWKAVLQSLLFMLVIGRWG
jgi:predicted small integral membrane protein